LADGSGNLARAQALNRVTKARRVGTVIHRPERFHSNPKDTIFLFEPHCPKHSTLQDAAFSQKLPLHSSDPDSSQPTTTLTSEPLTFVNTPLLPINNMASSASKRLFKEYRMLSNDPPEGITAGPVSEDDMFVWEALIQGPEGTPFEGGVFPAELRFPKDYPLAPPKMKFMTDMWHPNGTYDTIEHADKVP
jgi:hypothetical protein